VFAVGNHDVGFNSYAKPSDPSSKSKNYFNYLPQSYLNPNKTGVPPPQNRSTTNLHLLGPLLLLSLDSGYLHNHSSQVPFILSTLTTHPSSTPLAVYHNPLYPSCYDNSSTTDHWQEFD
jgi:hypothetical protein